MSSGSYESLVAAAKEGDKVALLALADMIEGEECQGSAELTPEVLGFALRWMARTNKRPAARKKPAEKWASVEHSGKWCWVRNGSQRAKSQLGLDGTTPERKTATIPRVLHDAVDGGGNTGWGYATFPTWLEAVVWLATQLAHLGDIREGRIKGAK